MKRALVTLALLVALAPVVTAGAAGATVSSSAEGAGVSAPLAAAQDNGTATPNGTTTPTATPAPNETVADSGGPPSSSETVRVLPVQLEPDFVAVETVSQGETYNTTGPFAFFSVSESVDEVTIQQQGATATVLEGGNVVRVEYDSDAAPVGQQSLYQLQLWYEDGSTSSLDLYASQTSVDVGSEQMQQYRPVVLEMLDDAESNGYDRTQDGLESHYTDLQETAQLLDSLFTERAKRLAASVASIFLNPLGIAGMLIAAVLVALWQLRRNSRALEFLSQDSGKAARLRERLWIEYKNQQQTAADEHLRELSGVGEMGEIYWSDAFGVDTTAGLAELFRQGLPVERDGEIRHVGGVDDLDAENIDSSWIEAVCREHRLPSPEIALSHGQTALHRMISKYGMAHHYQEAYEDVSELLDELDESRDVTRHSASTRSLGGGGGAGAAPGGDD